MQRIWIISGAVVAVWLTAFAVSKLAEASRPTPDSMLASIASNPLSNLSGSDRQQQIERLADQLNRLEFEERRELQRDPQFRAFFESMTPDEQSVYLELTLPEGFRQMMRALNEMTPERRQRIVDRALAEIEESDGAPQTPRPEDELHAKKIISEGMSAFYEEANADVKLDFAPVIEQIQRSLQRGR